MANTPQNLIELICYSCRMSIWVAESNHRKLLDEGGTFYCLNGHGQVFSTPRVVDLENRLNKEKEANVVLRRAVEDLEQRIARRSKKKK